QTLIGQQTGLDVIDGEVVALIQEAGGRIAGVRLKDGSVIAGRSVVLTSGTFLGGIIFRGAERMAGGRIGEHAATELAAQMRELNLPMGRLKTGTPARLDGRTIDWGALASQPSDHDLWHMSFLGGDESMA